jgi:SAM-dependent methyltransferase
MELHEYYIMRDLENTYWWFRGKRLLIGMFLNDYLKDVGSNRTLDIGAGTGSTLALLREYGPTYGIELSRAAIDMLKQRGIDSVVCANAERPIPFKRDTFSAITCLDVLEHLENDSGFLEEMIRVCKPGGTILITVPAMPFLWSRHDEALHHKRRYTKNGFLNRIAALNCTVTRFTYYNASLLLPIAMVRIFKNLLLPDRKKTESDFFMPLPNWLNETLFLWFAAELKYLKIANVPFGLSIVAVIQKPQKN